MFAMKTILLLFFAILRKILQRPQFIDLCPSTRWRILQNSLFSTFIRSWYHICKEDNRSILFDATLTLSTLSVSSAESYNCGDSVCYETMMAEYLFSYNRRSLHTLRNQLSKGNKFYGSS